MPSNYSYTKTPEQIAERKYNDLRRRVYVKKEKMVILEGLHKLEDAFGAARTLDGAEKVLARARNREPDLFTEGPMVVSSWSIREEDDRFVVVCR